MISSNLNEYLFPFGSPLKKVEQQVRTPKEAFVLGVYASAVHARWTNPEGETVVAALAVASEPEIFWRGDPQETLEIIRKIHVPAEVGHLTPASKINNGPSGRALDEKILTPLKLNRENTWLCDLIPHSLANEGQLNAISREYTSLIPKYNLPISSIPPVPKQLTDFVRRKEILSELEESRATKLILLGDKPIQWFLDYFIDKKITRLSSFSGDYGTKRKLSINGKEYEVYAFAHPRQIAGLGSHNKDWYTKHEKWMEGIS